MTLTIGFTLTNDQDEVLFENIYSGTVADRIEVGYSADGVRGITELLLEGTNGFLRKLVPAVTGTHEITVPADTIDADKRIERCRQDFLDFVNGR